MSALPTLRQPAHGDQAALQPEGFADARLEATRR
jgi:hypothetical protein